MKTISLTQVAYLRLRRSAGLWLILSMLCFAAAWLFWLMLDRYVQLQHTFVELSQLPSVTEQLLLPFFKTSAQLNLFIIALVCGGAVAREKQQGTWYYLAGCVPKWVRGQWLAAWMVSWVLFLLLGLVWWCLSQGSQLHQQWLLIALLGWLLLAGWLKSLALWISSWGQHSTTTTLLTLVVFVILWLVGQSSAGDVFGVNWLALLSPEKHFSWLLSGQLSWSSIIYFVGGTILFLVLTGLFAQQVSIRFRLIGLVMVLSLFWLTAIFVAARWLPVQSFQVDYGTLLPSTAKKLLADQQDLVVDVFAEPDSVAAKKVNQFLMPLLTEAPLAQTNYLSPAAHAETMAQLGLSVQGSMRVSVGDKQFVMKELSYEQFFNGLKKMQMPSDQWLVLLNGFLNEDFYDESPTGFSEWLMAMKQAGYAVAMMDWQVGLNMPSNVKALILNNPDEALSDQAIEWLQQQLAAGISMWWLTNPEQLIKQEQLSLLFDAFPASQFHAGTLVLRDYPDHKINQDFDRPIDLDQVALFDTVSEPVWQTVEGDVLAVSQVLNGSRTLAVGDNDYVSNQKLFSGGNLEMAFRQLDWLLGIDQRIDLPTIGREYSQVLLSKKQVLFFSVLMLLVLPISFLFMAIKTKYSSRR